jgi:hypothetical protein
MALGQIASELIAMVRILSDQPFMYYTSVPRSGFYDCLLGTAEVTYSREGVGQEPKSDPSSGRR